MKKFTRGLLPTIYNISEHEIEKAIKEYKRKNKKDQRGNSELRALAINKILFSKQH